MALPLVEEREGGREGGRKRDGRKCSGFLNPSAIVQVIYFISGHLFAGTSVSFKLFATTAVMAVIFVVADRQISSLQTAFSNPAGASLRPAGATASLPGHLVTGVWRHPEACFAMLGVKCSTSPQGEFSIFKEITIDRLLYLIFRAHANWSRLKRGPASIDGRGQSATLPLLRNVCSTLPPSGIIIVITQLLQQKKLQEFCAFLFSLKTLPSHYFF